MHGDPRLSRAIIDQLDSLPPNQRPIVSDISLWEVATLVSLGRLDLQMTLESWFRVAAHKKTVRVWPVTARIATEVAQLPDSFHRDPADRLILSTSRVLGLPLLTHDDRMINSGLARLWGGATRGQNSQLRKSLPRLFELRAAVSEPEHDDSYFKDFEASLQRPSGKLEALTRLEAQLSVLQRDSWLELRDRAARHAISNQRGKGRGWQEMFDVFSEARAYGYLTSIGAEEIRFIPRGETKTPDLAATTADHDVLCEVKTLNISKVQADKNVRLSAGEVVSSKALTSATEGLLRKVREMIEDALGQLAAYDPTRAARWIVFVAVNSDDSLFEYIDRILGQIDQHLDNALSTKVDLVFAPQSNPFERRLSMRNAAVYLD
jgi:PIN domain nuclease of toxin-antitoxin system